MSHDIHLTPDGAAVYVGQTRRTTVVRADVPFRIGGTSYCAHFPHALDLPHTFTVHPLGGLSGTFKVLT